MNRKLLLVIVYAGMLICGAVYITIITVGLAVLVEHNPF